MLKLSEWKTFAKAICGGLTAGAGAAGTAMSSGGNAGVVLLAGIAGFVGGFSLVYFVPNAA